MLLLGDFNYHVNAEDNVYTTELFGLFECFVLKNPVEMEIHIKCNTLIIVITRENEIPPMDVTTDTSIISDYSVDLFGIPAPKPLSETKITKCHRWKTLNLNVFKAGLSVSDIKYQNPTV